MIKIKHKATGKVLLRVEAESLDHQDLSRANLTGADFRDANLVFSNLSGARLSEADLRTAQLDNADLVGARLVAADLRGASLRGAALTKATLELAKLDMANLTGADLEGADLSNTVLSDTDLSDTRLRGANLADAVCMRTKFLDCKDLHEVRGLSEIRQVAASYLDAQTLRHSVSRLPDAFLQGVGYTNSEIEYLRALYTDAIQYFSCFLSHSGSDGQFADRLRLDLLDNNVSCWHFRYDMRGGQFWRAQINEAIKVHEKLILVCSRQSVKRDNVVDEILQAMDRERKDHVQRLFPIRLDEYILNDEALEFGDEQVRKGVWPENWIRFVQRYHIPDFRQWKDHDAYRTEFVKLLDALKNPAKRELL